MDAKHHLNQISTSPENRFKHKGLYYGEKLFLVWAVMCFKVLANSCSSATLSTSYTGSAVKSVTIVYDGISKSANMDFLPNPGTCELTWSCTADHSGYVSKFCNGVAAGGGVSRIEDEIYYSSSANWAPTTDGT